MGAADPTIEERVRAFRARVGRVIPGGRSTELEECSREIDAACAAGDVSFLVALSELRHAEEPFMADTYGELAFLRLPFLRTDEALRAFLAGASRPPTAYEATRAGAHDVSRRRDGALLAYALGDALGDAAAASAARWVRDGDEAATEVVTCFVQERVIAGGDPGRFEGVAAFWEQVKRDTPLGELPLRLLPLERGALQTPPHTELHTGGYVFRCELYAPPRKNAPPTMPVVIEAVREATAEETSTMGAVMAHHPLFPNATIEAHVLTLTQALPNTADHASVVGLLLPCLEDPEPGSFFEEAIDAREVFGRLIKVATEGGCYGKGQSAAYGRLYAWQTLAALLGLPRGTSLAAIEAEANRASFTWFRLHGPWYFNISVDIGLACLRGDRRTLVVLAGTDCD